MVYALKQINLLKNFQCLGDKCEDTCCKGWGMQLDAPHKKLYEQKAPELLEAVSTGEAELIMKRDPATDYCVKFEGGLCGIHKKYGEDFLGDACNFYPRVTRKLGEETFMSASPSCPEILRLAFDLDSPFSFNETKAERLPHSLKSYLNYEGLEEAKAITVFESFLKFAGGEDKSAERIMSSILSVATSLMNLPASSWGDAVNFYLRTAESRLMPAESNENDNLYLVQSLAALIHASKKSDRSRLMQTISEICKMLGIEIDWQTLNIIQNNKNSYPEFSQKYSANKQAQIYLKRWLQAELSESLFPFSGLGKNFSERALIISVRFATIRLGVIALHEKNQPEKSDVVRSMQSISRFMGHLSDPTLSLQLYENFGWNSEAKLRSLAGDL